MAELDENLPAIESPWFEENFQANGTFQPG